MRIIQLFSPRYSQHALLTIKHHGIWAQLGIPSNHKYIKVFTSEKKMQVSRGSQGTKQRMIISHLLLHKLKLCYITQKTKI